MADQALRVCNLDTSVLLEYGDLWRQSNLHRRRAQAKGNQGDNHTNQTLKHEIFENRHSTGADCYRLDYVTHVTGRIPQSFQRLRLTDAVCSFHNELENTFPLRSKC